MKKFTSLAQILASPWGQLQQLSKPQTTDRIYKSTRLEDSIYANLRQEDTTLNGVLIGTLLPDGLSDF